MTINLQALKCAECGSGTLGLTALNHYVCEYCGAVTLVENDVSERLGRVLEQVKRKAAKQLADEWSARNREVNRSTAIFLVVTAGLAVGWTAFDDYVLKPRAAAIAEVTLSPSAAKLDFVPVDGSAVESSRPAVARNVTSRPVEPP